MWANNEPRSWVNWKKDHSRSHLPSSGKIRTSIYLPYKFKSASCLGTYYLYEITINQTPIEPYIAQKSWKEMRKNKSIIDE